VLLGFKKNKNEFGLFFISTIPSKMTYLAHTAEYKVIKHALYTIGEKITYLAACLFGLLAAFASVMLLITLMSGSGLRNKHIPSTQETLHCLADPYYGQTCEWKPLTYYPVNTTKPYISMVNNYVVDTNRYYLYTIVTSMIACSFWLISDKCLQIAQNMS
jgi:hypothetical protein